ncbi:hypothetical protein COU14_01175 [Candidatus Kaiserbacteria bacterium CG10_big_fil_rev_8_21_14_0_10_44_10]|uniref:Uncharacterized protein n=1 Tax=Candidatus Kaiserbacteria bacterium CG10_big_fil_rev_8_21_14_0_10_44_10 TaxID=1974606 RepID=A0A2H0UHX5_9BACT|nr:MAG: hypothetical protein COU14_01175 [Candidatus Kaiserbacteria bacterium CG10_big_fil_rev_8_21_14_0_10_44_10]
MKRDDWMLLSLTFLTGLAIGMYVYLMAFKPIYVPDNLNDTETEAGEWSLVAKRYSDGSSRYVEPSFRVLSDRSYVYLPGGNSDSALSPIEGKLSSGLMRDLREYDDELVAYIYPPLQPNCPSARGGYDYEYRITVDNTVYLLDTCETALGQSSELAVLLQEAWSELEGSGRPTGSFSDWAENWLNERIGVN